MVSATEGLTRRTWKTHMKNNSKRKYCKNYTSNYYIDITRLWERFSIQGFDIIAIFELAQKLNNIFTKDSSIGMVHARKR